MKIFAVTMILFTALLVGCGKEKTVEPATSYRADKFIHATSAKSCTCFLDTNDVDTMAMLYEDEKYDEIRILYRYLVESDKLLLVREDTSVACYYSEEYRGYVPVVFYEGNLKDGVHTLRKHG